MSEKVSRTQSSRMRLSSYSVLCCTTALSWCLQVVLEEWLTCQRSWLYLEPIFSSDDINQQLPVEGKRYQQMEQTWRRIMKSAFNNRKVRATTTRKGVVFKQRSELDDNDAHLFFENCSHVFLHLSLGDWAVSRCSSTRQTKGVQRTVGTGAEGPQWVLGDKTRLLPSVSLTERVLRFP